MNTIKHRPEHSRPRENAQNRDVSAITGMEALTKAKLAEVWGENDDA